MSGGWKKHMELKLEQMVTERRNENTMNLDMMSPLEIVTVMNQEQTAAGSSIWVQEQAEDWACLMPRNARPPSG